jgi:translocation protein SEC66
LLKAALLRRAAADVTRIIRIREDKPALQALMQKGTVGDDLWASCLLAEKELEAELLEVVAEANTFQPGWGQFIFGSAGEILGHDRIKELLSTIDRRHQDTGKPSQNALKSSILTP